MIKYENTTQGLFMKRVNRFTATVLVDGKEETAHVKNTGRLKELLLPGAKVVLQRADNPDRKTAFDLISVYSEKLEWVNIDSLVPNALIKQYLSELDYDVVKPEYKYGDSRIDFYMEKDGERYLMEVKGCTLASDNRQGIGLFPDAPTERGVRHLNELVRAAKEGYHCSVAFVIQMNGISKVLPNNESQPEFGEALTKAVNEGVGVRCFRCRVNADSIKIIGVDG